MNKFYFGIGFLVIVIIGFVIGFFGRGIALAKSFDSDVSVAKLEFIQSLSANSFNGVDGGGSCGN